MGKGSSRLPPINERDLRILMSYGLEERHMKKLWNKFLEVDTDCNGVWTVWELYRVIEEPRLSLRAPIIEALFFMSDAKSEGALDFQDFLVTLTSFCALSKEEILQLLFIIVDRDRNGRVEKEELLEFFSYRVAGGGVYENEPIFPVNNKNALDQFRRGKWESVEFDGLAQLCERFPFISYPAFHVQELYRSKLLGRAFWQRLDESRSKSRKGSTKTRRVRLPGSDDKVEIKLPGRCTMQELLEYSRRKTAVVGGRRIAKHMDEDETDSFQVSSAITKDRDEQISRCPLLVMIRNSRCMYYVPYNPKDDPGSKEYKSALIRQRPEMELPALELEPFGSMLGPLDDTAGPWNSQVPSNPAAAAADDDESESSSGSYEESSGEEYALAAEPQELKDSKRPLQLADRKLQSLPPPP